MKDTQVYQKLEALLTRHGVFHSRQIAMKFMEDNYSTYVVAEEMDTYALEAYRGVIENASRENARRVLLEDIMCPEPLISTNGYNTIYKYVWHIPKDLIIKQEIK